MISTIEVSDSEHLANIIKIASINDFDEEVMPKIHQYLAYFGLRQDSYWSQPEIPLEEYIERLLEEINPNA